ncbi:hypothetical protein LNKW23_09560 [Paralimibaculum aggregatum]|uniref:Uncharacterized protein n=1 Tax=Paralimibaculum aggregatum TaxID=3036245 RepID=A0ABQ6LLN9_9RHOB|nr:hypothetical protein [Limibaculum sp. NKW23]GMG81743.1 hypothetical protein LNKW23_09560 [Limibaculum sp. NKW23]
MWELEAFVRDDSGSATSDWVALAAGILLLGMIVIYGIYDRGVVGVVDDMNTELSAFDLDQPDAGLDAYGSRGAAAPAGQPEGAGTAETVLVPSYACDGGGACIYDTDGDGLVDAIGGPDGPVQATGPGGIGSSVHGQPLAAAAAGAGMPVRPISARDL